MFIEAKLFTEELAPNCEVLPEEIPIPNEKGYIDKDSMVKVLKLRKKGSFKDILTQMMKDNKDKSSI